VVGATAADLRVARPVVEHGQLTEELAGPRVLTRLPVTHTRTWPDTITKKPVPISPSRTITPPWP
jgi:hypothetical protein